MLVTGRQGDTVHFRNPSGHTEQARTASLTVAEFAEFFGGRGVPLPEAATAADSCPGPGTGCGGPRPARILSPGDELTAEQAELLKRLQNQETPTPATHP
ncbi:hypothetical protein [Streptomyces sp. NPDC058296]|uniref:hypothetical protein n=1 Tax=Streptomyces sp. NPDC058296 TaxID=3346432 RepID=UPI0036E082D2